MDLGGQQKREQIITMPSIGQLVECRQPTWNLQKYS